MKTIVDMAMAWTGMGLETYLKTCRGWTAARPALLRSGQVARARQRRWSSFARGVRWPSHVRICLNERLSACKLGAPFEGHIRCAGRVGGSGREDGERRVRLRLSWLTMRRRSRRGERGSSANIRGFVGPVLNLVEKSRRNGTRAMLRDSTSHRASQRG